MPFPFTCPSCRTTSQVLDHLAGTRAKCPTCGDVVPIPAVGRPVEGIPTIPPLVDEQPPVARTGGGAGALIALVLAGLFQFVCCGGGGVVGLIAVRDSARGKPDASPKQAAAPTSKGEERPALVGEKELYRQLLKSTAWVIAADGRRTALGSASVVHREQRLLLTNYHIVRNHPRVIVMFPFFKPDGEPITQASYYFEAAEKKGINASLAASDPARDLALLQVNELPIDVKPLRLAADGPDAGQRVWSISAADRIVGFGDEDGALWRFETLQVKRTLEYHHRYKDRQQVTAQALEMNGSGDNGFGGPVVDERGQLLGALCDFG